MIKDVAIQYQINYNYLKKLWRNRRLGLNLRAQRKRIDSIGDFSEEITTQIYRDCFAP